MENRVENSVDIHEVIRERRSVRHYDSAVKISRQELKEMLEAAVRAPSSSNLQPWRFLVIDDQGLKEKLFPIALQQQQVLDASAIIAVFGDMEGYKQAERIYQHAVDEGFMSEEVKQMFVDDVNSRYANRELEIIKEIALVDAGLVSMQFMLIAKARGYDTVPMGGYDTQQFITAFQIPDRYLPIMLIAVGKATEPGHPTTRLSVEEVTFWNEISE